MAKEIKVRLILQDIQTNSGSLLPEDKSIYNTLQNPSTYIKNTIEYLPKEKVPTVFMSMYFNVHEFLHLLIVFEKY